MASSTLSIHPNTLKELGLDLEGRIEKLLRLFRDGKLLVERSRSKRVRFAVSSRFEFWDLEPYLKMYRKVGDVR